MRRMKALAVLAGFLGALLTLVLAPAASAQTGYPPGLCTTITGTQAVGVVQIGQRFVLQVAPTCLFTPGAQLTVTVNGVDIPGKTAEPGGFVLVDVTVVSATQLSIDDPVLTPAFCGTNTVVASGPSSSAQGGTSTQTATFTIDCPAGTTPTTVRTQGLLSRTGADTARPVAIALALVVSGAMALVVTRRRRSTTI
jgi:hypothetical protein